MKGLINKVKERLIGTQDNTIYIKNPGEIQSSKKYSIGITTFDKRFEKFFKPLIEKIKLTKPDIEIIVMVNCNYQEKFNESYKKELLEFISRYDNIFPHICSEFRSLSKLWNNELIFSSNDSVLLCNDDITIEKEFWSDLEYAIEINEGRCFTINKTWSHVFLNKSEINEVGWFDERLLGVGEEDGDMQFRWEKYYNMNFPNYNIKNIKNHIDESCSTNIEKHSNSKYSRFNRSFIEKKFVVNHEIGAKLAMFTQPVICKIADLKQYPYEQFFWDNKNNL